jgi:predicted lipase
MNPDKTEIAELMFLSSLIYSCRKEVQKGSSIKALANKLPLVSSISSDLELAGSVVYCHSNTSDLQAGITLNHSKKRITLVFRGSESWKDWIHDFFIWQKTLHGDVKVHYGMYRQLQRDFSYNTIRREMRKLHNEYPDYRINVTGHSLGGGLALLFAYKFSVDHINLPIRCVSFASPKVGNKIFAEAVNKRNNLTHIRCYNSKDIIPMLPFRGYKHVGEQLKLCKDSIEYTNTKETTMPKLFSSCWSLKEHKCEIYNQRLHDYQFKEVDEPLLTIMEESAS